MYCHNKANSSGFSLIEVLVTVAIVSFGLMGLISLMLKSLQANATSGLRTMAVAQAYDMADRMRANMAGIKDGSYNAIVPPGSSSTCPININGNVGVATSTLGSCGACTSACTAAQIAQRDACIWHEQNSKLLPKGSGAVCKDGSSSWYAISISWDENKGGTPNKTFILRFEP
ncbi:type IV pilus modification protein PilV [Propionivibrio limicola]|uniref:type IV pilus modification protein PilV n=1 Tax=Propionivibrio limicola TaxID=167645 RepID=UPI003CCC9F93